MLLLRRKEGEVRGSELGSRLELSLLRQLRLREGRLGVGRGRVVLSVVWVAESGWRREWVPAERRWIPRRELSRRRSSSVQKREEGVVPE